MIKDLMCLRKQLMVFIYVVFGVFAVSVMYVLSIKYGNIALAGKEMMKTEDVSMIDVRNLGTGALVIFMLLPIASIGDMVNIFLEDAKAGFFKVAGMLPLSIGKRLLARYMTIFALFGIGALVDILIAAVLSRFTDLVSFTEFVGIIVSAASVMSIYSALAILYCILLGNGKEQYSMVLSLLTMLVGFLLLNLRKTKEIVVMILSSETAAKEDGDVSMLWDALDFIKGKAYILFLTAVGVVVGSYVISYVVTSRKRGVI